MAKTIDIDKLINRLIAEKETGGKTIIYNGTLICPETDNTVVLISEANLDNLLNTLNDYQ